MLFLTYIFRVIFLLVFDNHFSLFHASSSPLPVAGDMAMVFLDACFLSLKAGSSLHSYIYFADSIALPFRGLGVGFEEPHFRLMF